MFFYESILPVRAEFVGLIDLLILNTNFKSKLHDL